VLTEENAAVSTNRSDPLLEVEDIHRWKDVFWTEIEQRLSPLFARTEARASVMAYLAGLLSPLERKNSWQLAESSGKPNPYPFQHLLGRAIWDADIVRDHLRSYIIDHLADDQAVMVIDETGFLKKGVQSAGVERQYSGTAGRIENCQIGVFLAYATNQGHTLVDRELYVPVSWTNDPERCRRAGIPDDYTFATKPVLAQTILERAFANGLTAAWVTGDCIYGDSRPLRRFLEARAQPYVLGVSGKETVWIGERQHAIPQLVSDLPPDAWRCVSAGEGSKGPRLYEWQSLEIAPPEQSGWKRWLLVRRSLSDTDDVAKYISCGPAHTTLEEQVRVAGMRWTVEECIQTAKGEVGLDHYEVRSWTGWYRHITLAMWAQAFLTVVRQEMGSDVAIGKKETMRTSRSLAAFKANRGLRYD
jgi:SRSO17 transposase